MRNLAIIPARGGSKRIPKKNIKDFLGKPIMAYSIETALHSGLFDEVMVSTDDEEIAQIALQYGAKVPFMRSEKTANNFAPTVEVLKEVEEEYRNQFHKEFDYICCIYATAPFITEKHLEEGFRLLMDKNLSSVFPIVPFSYPVWRSLRINEQGKTEMVWEKYINTRSQDIEPLYHDAGQWYWYNPKKITNSLFTNNSSSIILSEEIVQDIDTFSDWKIAEIKYGILQNLT
ncbi:MAG: pseudaminic acid cytidylyltransferase [Bacteroidota bacterium]